jgi:hypothetical protein
MSIEYRVYVGLGLIGGGREYVGYMINSECHYYHLDDGSEIPNEE